MPDACMDSWAWATVFMLTKFIMYFLAKMSSCIMYCVLFPLNCARYHWPESLQTFSLMPAQWAGHRHLFVLEFVTFYGMCCTVNPWSGYM